MTALGFVGLYDSVWIRPGSTPRRSRAGAATSLLHHVEGARWSVLHVRFDEEAGPHGPAAAYDLTGLASALRGLHRAVRAVAGGRPRWGGGPGHGAGGAYLRDGLLAEVRRRRPGSARRTCCRSPGPASEARETFLDIHSALGALAQTRLIEVATPHWPDAATWITHFQASRDSARPEPTGGTRPTAGTAGRQADNTLTLFVTPVIVTA